MRNRLSVVVFSLLLSPCPFAAAEKDPFERYRVVEERNLFAPLAAGAASSVGGASAAAGGGAVLTGIVYDIRRGGYRGVIEAAGQAEPRFVGPGDATAAGTVARVTEDRLVILVPPADGQGTAHEVEVTIGAPLPGSGNGGGAVEAAPDAGASPPAAAGLPEVPEALRGVLDRLKAKRGKSVDTRADGGENRGAAPADALDAGVRSVLDRMKSRLGKGDKEEKGDKPQKGSAEEEAWKAAKEAEKALKDEKPPKEEKPWKKDKAGEDDGSPR